MDSFHRLRALPWRHTFVLGVVALLFCSTISAQEAGSEPASDKQLVQILMKRIDQLEARVNELEAAQRQAVAAQLSPRSDPPVSQASVPGPPPDLAATHEIAAPKPAAAPAQDAEPAQSENAMNERMDVSKTLLRIRGFGDVSVHGDTQKGDNTSFSLGQLDLFVTSDVSDRFKFLSEIVFEGGPDDIYGKTVGESNLFTVDVERYQLQYSHNDYFNISAGRGHTAIGYYNTAYHHSTWLQTTTGRPLLFDFEDRGGILPIHMVGASASGLIPSGSLGLHYVAEIGNGRASRTPLDEESVQNEVDDENHKAFNFAVFAKPEGVSGLQAGLSFYRDLLKPANSPKISETILAAHAVLIRPKYEWLNEALVDRHAVLGTSATFNTPGFYTQVSKQYGAYRPYFRYQYVNVANKEPVFPDIALRHGPSLGLRFDASESVALKFQYDYTFLRNQPGVTGLNLQLGFTF